MYDTFFKILAILGALAWLSPIVIPWIKRKLIESKITIKSDNILEIGYNTLGPILNINFAFLITEREALIEKINLHLQHEDKESHIFKWEWFEEQLLQMDVPEYGSMPFKKNQKAVAIYAATNILVEKKIGFQSEEFKRQYFNLILQTNEKFDNLSKGENQKDNLKITDEYNNLIEHFESSFLWKKGKYNAIFEILIHNQKSSFKHEIAFEISKLDISILKINVKTCKDLIQNSYIDQKIDFPTNWKWVYPIKQE